MPSYIQSNFSAGEWAPEYSARVDEPKYRSAVALARNMIVLPNSGLTRRPGFRWVAAAKNGTNQPVRLVRFSPATDVVFTLEFGPSYIRFFRRRGAVLSAGVPFELATPYAAGDLEALSFTQDQGRAFIWSGAHPPQILQWGATSDIDWNLAAAVFTDGPYLAPVVGATVTPGAASAATTLTASSTSGINGGTGFRADDVGRLLRVQTPTWGITSFGAIIAPGAGYLVGDTIVPAVGSEIHPALWTVTAIGGGGAVAGLARADVGEFLIVQGNPVLQRSTSGSGAGLQINCGFSQDQTPQVWLSCMITVRNSSTSVNVTVGTMVLDNKQPATTLAGQFVDTNPRAIWQLGAWSPYEGYPRTGGGIYQQRLLIAATSGTPKGFWASQTADFTGMAPSLATGQVTDSNAIAFKIGDGDADPINWMIAAGRAQVPQIAIGGGPGEFIMEPSIPGAALSPTNVQSYRETKEGNAAVPPLFIGKALLFIDKSLQRLRQWIYQFGAGGYVAPEVAPYGRHLLLSGVKRIDYATRPYRIVWALCNDGTLAGLTYQADAADTAMAAWHSHRLGGSVLGGPAAIRSFCVSSSELQAYDEIWVAVDRASVGGSTRTIEVSVPPFRDQPVSEAVFVDSAISSAVTNPVATCVPDPVGPFQPSGNTLLPARGDFMGFGFTADVALASDLIPGTVLRMNNGTFRVTQVGGPRVITAQVVDVPRDLTQQPTGFWSYTKMATVFTGFAALNGEEVAILGDGAVYAPRVVAGGTITLDTPASYITVGLNAPSEMLTLDLDLPAPDGTSQMKTGRLDHLYVRFFETIGGEYGPDADHLDTLDPRDTDDLLDWAPSLISDDFRVAMPGGSSEHRTVYVRQTNPWPMTVLALVVKGGTTEQAPR